MGLRLHWEISDLPLLCFTSVRTLSRHLPWHPVESSNPDFFAAKPQEARFGPPALHFVRKICLDRPSRDFFRGVHQLISGCRAEAAQMFRNAAAGNDTLADAYFALALCTDDAQEQLESVDRALIQKKNFTRLFKEADINLCGTIIGCDQKELHLMSDFPGLELLAAEVFQNHGKLEYASRLL
ncbi:MAG: hypothetical protein SCM57_12890, partial [Bacillota bacterium]|nr:hypothetical protein [Bacillota bacterium]